MKDFIKEALHRSYSKLIISEGQDETKFSNLLKDLNAKVEPNTGTFFEFKSGPSRVIFKHSKTKNTLVLELIETPNGSRGGGHASNALKTFLDVVDKYGYNVELIVSPRDNETNFEKLGEFYQNFGFNYSSEGGFDSEFEMIR
jgi:hypothetical protein